MAQVRNIRFLNDHRGYCFLTTAKVWYDIGIHGTCKRPTDLDLDLVF